MRYTRALTIHGVTKSVTLAVENLGTAADPWGNQRIACTARGSIDRKELGLGWYQVIEAGGFLVGDKVERSMSRRSAPPPAPPRDRTSPRDGAPHASTTARSNSWRIY